VPSTQPDPTPVRCPVLTGPSPAPVDPAVLDPLLDRLADPTRVQAALTFPCGTLQPDGRLDLCKQGLGPAGLERVLPAAVGSPHAVHLLLGTNNLGATGVASLARTLTAEHRVRTLYLGCNHIDAAGVEPLAARLATDRTVRALWLKRNPIGDEGVATVAAALRENPTVRTLDLTNTGMTVRGLRALTGALAARSAPTERLYLGGNGLGADAADLLARLLGEVGVHELYLAAGQLGDDGARALSAALPGRHRVVLGLGGNGLGPDGVRALAARLGSLDALDLARPPSAQVLRALPNEVGDDGVAALADALPASGLRRLDLRHTGVTGRGARMLLAALGTGPALEQLGLGSGVPRRIKRAVGTVLRPLTGPAEDIAAIASVYR
jgi:Ran GTPase-activating protein (RanGAP) involved in mRNA processing and transport